MKIALMVIDLHLEGCRSLKEKRGRLASLRDRLGKQPNLAICESEHQDALQRAQWSFVATANDAKTLERTLAGIETHVLEHLDARILDVRREPL